MVDESGEHILWAVTAPEIAAQLFLFVLLAVSLFGDSSFLLSVSRQIRMAALVFLGIELLIPLSVYFDIRQNPERSDMIWVHIAAMPFLNFFGLVAYLVDRKVKREQNE